MSELTPESGPYYGKCARCFDEDAVPEVRDYAVTDDLGGVPSVMALCAIHARPARRCTVCGGSRIYDEEKKRFTACSFLGCKAPTQDAEDERADPLTAEALRAQIAIVRASARNVGDFGKAVFAVARALERRLASEEWLSNAHLTAIATGGAGRVKVDSTKLTPNNNDLVLQLDERVKEQENNLEALRGRNAQLKADNDQLLGSMSKLTKARDDLIAGLNVKEAERRRHRDALQAWADEFAPVWKAETRFPSRDVALFDACMNLGLRVQLIIPKHLPTLWRTGHKLRQTLYRNDALMGFLDSSVDARAVVNMLNAAEATSENAKEDKRRDWEREAWLKALLLKFVDPGSNGFTAAFTKEALDRTEAYDFSSAVNDRETFLSISAREGASIKPAPQAFTHRFAPASLAHEESLVKALVRRLTFVGGPNSRVELNRDEIARADRFQLRRVDNGHVLALSVVDDT